MATITKKDKKEENRKVEVMLIQNISKKYFGSLIGGIMIIPDADIEYTHKQRVGNRYFINPVRYKTYQGWKAVPIMEDLAILEDVKAN